MADVDALRAKIEGLQVRVFFQLELKQAETQATAASFSDGVADSDSLVAPYSRSYGRTPIAAVLRPSTPGGDEGNLPLVGRELTVGGWVRTGREALAGALAFVGLNDGSCQGVLQVVLPAEVAAAFAAEQAASSSSSSSVPSPSGASCAAASADAAAATMKAACQMGACLLVSGVVVLSKPHDPEKLKRDREAGKPEKKTQLVELKATRLLHLGTCDNGKGAYPLAGKGRHTLEHLREVAHLRPRTATFGAIARVRSCLAAATHEFFQSRGFHYCTSPLITASDCEGAGEMFQVTTLLVKADEEYQRERESGGGPVGPAASASAAPAATAGGKAAAPAHAAPAAAAAAEEEKPVFVPPLPPEEVAALEATAAEFGDRVRALKAAKAPKEEVEAAVALLKEAKEKVFAATGGKKAAKEQEAKSKKKAAAPTTTAASPSSAVEAAAAAAPPVMLGGLPRSAADGRIDYSADFFGKPAFLTVSGQLNAEYYACALTSVYTFGPTFRAENSHTSRHLAEFWMIEPEIAFADLKDDMRCAEDFITFCVRKALATCSAELDFLENHTGGAEKGKAVPPVAAAGTRKRLEAIAAPDSPGFARVSYTEAVEILRDHVRTQRVKFELPVEWGVDLASEHERYLTDVVHQGRPVIVYDYPKEIKAFYMRANDDGKTVAAMDILVPGVGELVGGSQREERLDVLVKKLEEMGERTDSSSPYSPYLDLRRYGKVPHAGFGVGFERLVQFVAGLDNIRDSIPFPRWPNNAAF